MIARAAVGLGVTALAVLTGVHSSKRLSAAGEKASGRGSSIGDLTKQQQQEEAESSGVAAAAPAAAALSQAAEEEDPLAPLQAVPVRAVAVEEGASAAAGWAQ